MSTRTPAPAAESGLRPDPPHPIRFRPVLLLLVFIALSVEAATPRQILILHSFGRDFEPFNTVAPAFRTELARLTPERIVFHEASLEGERPSTSEGERPFVQFLQARYVASPPAMVVAIGAPAARFYLRYRQDLFPAATLVLAAADRRVADTLSFRRGDQVAVVNVDFPRIADNILRLRPETTTLAVVMGSSAFEHFWLKEIQKDLAPLADRVKLIWLTDLTLEQLRERVAALPSGSAVLYGLFAVGVDGVPHESGRALAALRAASSAPVFGVVDDEFGNGIVGGPLISTRETGVVAAQLAHRILAGDTPADRVVLEMTPPVFDWRELEHWGIPESRLPAGSEVRFRPPSLWEEHKPLILSAVAILLLQAALIAALLFQGARARRAENASATLAGRLLTAHQDERRRLARELHDDMTQRLARLAIDAGRLERGAVPATVGDIARSLREELVRLSEDVHAMSYRLHPSVLDDLGLPAALRTECDRLSRQESIRVEVDVRNVPQPLPPEPALCLFRVAQEALRNIARHAHARAVIVSLTARDGGLQLAVSDDGRGFDAAHDNQPQTLGQISMRERVRLLGGELDIESSPGYGTTVVARVPLQRAGA